MFSDSLLEGFNLLESDIVFPFPKIHVCSRVGALIRDREVKAHLGRSG